MTRTLLPLLLLFCLAFSVRGLQGQKAQAQDPAQLWQGYVADGSASKRQVLLALGAKAMPPLCKALSSRNRRERALAMRLLPALGKLAIPRLQAMWQGEDKRLSLSAERVLGRIGEEAIPVFVSGLYHLPLRKRAVKALRRFGKKSVDALLVELERKKPYQRVGILLALGEIGGDRVFAALQTGLCSASPLLRKAAAEALGVLRDPRAFDLLRERLVSDSSLDVRQAVASSLALYGQRAHALLSEAVDNDDDKSLRAFRPCMPIFASFGVKELIRALRSESPDMRMAALELLGSLGSKARVAEKAMAERLQDGSIGVHLHAIRALGELGSVSSETLEQLLTRSNAANTFFLPYPLLFRTLGKLQNPEVVPPLLEMLRDPKLDSGFRDLVAALRSRGPAIAPLVKKAMARKMSPKAHVRFLSLIRAMGQDLYPELILALQNKSSEVRNAAVKVAQDVGAPLNAVLAKSFLSATSDEKRSFLLRGALAIPTVPEAWGSMLFDSVASPDEQVRAQLAALLGRGGFPVEKARKALATLLGDQVPLVRRTAASAIGRRSKELPKLFSKMLRSEDVKLRVLAVRGFRSAESVDVRSLLCFIEDENAQVRRSALDGLLKAAALDAAAMQQVGRLLGDPANQVRSMARRVLLQQGKAARPLFLSALQQADWRVRYQAAEAFARAPELVDATVLAAVQQQLATEPSGLVRSVLSSILSQKQEN